MPWVYTTPEQETVDYDAIHVDGVAVTVLGSPAPRMWVTYARGVYNSDTEVFTATEESQVIEISAPVTAAILAATPPATTNRDAFEVAAYNALDADGISPPGAIE